MSDQQEQSGCAAMGSIGWGASVIIFAIIVLTSFGTGGLALFVWVPIGFMGLAYILRGGRTIAKKTGVEEAVRTASESLSATRSAPTPSQPPRAVSPVAQGTVIDEITKAHALLKSGAITQEEFERLKSEALTGRG